MHVAAGTYSSRSFAQGGHANTASGCVTYIGAPNQATHITGDAASYFLLGALLRDEKLKLPGRHLGLVQASETVIAADKS